MPSTCYLDDAAAKKAKEFKITTGKSVSRLIQEFIERYEVGLDGIERIAIVSKYEDIPSIDTLDDYQPDKYDFDTWIDITNVKKVFLMGTTMNRAIINHYGKWEKLLKAGQSFQVLLQGNLKNGEECFSNPTEFIEDVKSRRDESVRKLKQLSELNPFPNTLQVRNSGRDLINFSAVLIFKNDDMVDIQTQAYIFNHRGYSAPRVTISTPYGSSLYRNVTDVIHDFWKNSVREF